MSSSPASPRMPAPAQARPRRLVLAPDDDARNAAHAVVAFHLRALKVAMAGARDGDVEAVHQLRVATRRLRAGLRLFMPVLPTVTTRRRDDDLAWLGHCVGAVRDLDVLTLAIAARYRRLYPRLRDALGPLDAGVRERRAEAHAELIRILDSPRCRRLITRLEKMAEPTTRRAGTLGEIAPRVTRPLLAAVLRAGHAVTDDAPPHVLHRLRVRVKRLRYALETLIGLGGSSLDRILGRLVRLQDVLGEYQDATTQVEWLWEWARSQPPPETLLAVGALIHLLERGARKRRQRFARRWAGFDRRQLHRRLLAELSHSPGRRQPRRGLQKAVAP